MEIKEVEVKTFLKVVYCDCGEQMEQTGVNIFTDPPKIQMRCSKCFKEASIPEDELKTVYRTV